MRRLFAVVPFVTLLLSPLPAVARRHATPAPSPVPTATPTPAPSPTPALSPSERDERLREALTAIARAAPGRLGVTVIDLARDERVSVHGDDAFPLAGTVNLAVALVAFRRADQHHFRLDDLQLVTGADLRGQASAIARAHPRGNVWLTNAALVRGMLVDGDSTAVDVLLHELGGPEAVQRVLVHLGLRGFHIRRSEAELASDARAHRTFARGGDNAGTPNGIAELLTGIVQKQYAGLDATTEFVTLLSQVPDATAPLTAGLPPGTPFAHQTGTSNTLDGATDATNDAGFVTLQDGRRLVIVALLSDSHARESERDATLARVADAAYRAFVP